MERKNKKKCVDVTNITQTGEHYHITTQSIFPMFQLLFNPFLNKTFGIYNTSYRDLKIFNIMLKSSED